MRTKQFFGLTEPGRSGAVRGRSLPDGATAWDRAGRGAKFDHPLEVLDYTGNHAYDIMWATCISAIIIGPNVVEALAGLSGWGTFGVTVPAELGPGWQGLAIAGRCGPIDFDTRESALTFRALPGNPTAAFFKGLHFDESAWDGTDLFMGPQKGFQIVTKRLVDAFKRHRISNWRAVPIEDVELRALDSDIQWGQ